MSAKRNAARVLPLLLMTACPWFTDFKEQPRIEPWEQLYSDTMKVRSRLTDSLLDVRKIPSRGNPQFSVPIYGSSTPQYVVSYAPMPATVDSMSALANPTAPSDTSLANGRRYYQINCSVCHGAKGDGQGTVTKFGLPVPSLLTPQAMGYRDGYIYGMIRNGRGLMPSYDRIEEPDRWDVVNYVRGLQGSLGHPVSTDPAGKPGENGKMVPGFTHSAPTRPSPFYRAGAADRPATPLPADSGTAAAPSVRPGGETPEPSGPRPATGGAPGRTAGQQPPSPTKTKSPNGGRP